LTKLLESHSLQIITNLYVKNIWETRIGKATAKQQA